MAARIRDSMSGVLARYIRLVCALLRQSGIVLSPRRAVMLLRNIAGVHAARLLASPDADPSLSAFLALRHSLPQRATGHPVKELHLISAHKEAWKAAGAADDSPIHLLMAEPDPLRRALFAARCDTLGKREFSTVAADCLAALPPGARHALAAELFESGAAGRLIAAVAEQAAEWYAVTATPQDINETVQANGPRHRVWKHVVALPGGARQELARYRRRHQPADRAVRKQRTRRRGRRGPGARRLAERAADHRGGTLMERATLVAQHVGAAPHHHLSQGAAQPSPADGVSLARRRMEPARRSGAARRDTVGRHARRSGTGTAPPPQPSTPPRFPYPHAALSEAVRQTHRTRFGLPDHLRRAGEIVRRASICATRNPTWPTCAAAASCCCSFPKRRHVMTESPLAERILDAFPSGNYGLLALLRLLDIVETAEVDTAAVECTALPRLRINPEFVERHAETPERLLMLVMHELHHVLLGHTRLFPRLTAGGQPHLRRRHQRPALPHVPGRRSTRRSSPATTATTAYPECLLRPAAGWTPLAPVPVPPALEGSGMARVRQVYRALYSETGANYQELYDALRSVVAAGAGMCR